MTGDSYVGAIDQGTTGTRFVLFDREGRIVSAAYERHEQRHPEPGWVEHDLREIRENATTVVEAALAEADVDGDALAAIGIANQRETTALWDRETGEPVADAIVWQDRRTTGRIEELEAAGLAGTIRAKTGLEPDAYFSASKLEWLLEHGDPIRAERGPATSLRERAVAGELAFGTIDSWLIHSLTGEHVTDVTNASRTMLYDIRAGEWDEELLALFGVPRVCLPEVRPSIDEREYGRTDPDGFLGAAVPVAAALGDQQAALFGQGCFEPGEAKNTYGTGSFLLLNTGTDPVDGDGLLTTVAYGRTGEPLRYALEGSIFVTGAAIEWLADVGLIEEPAESERLARSVESTDGVYLVPAFAGLGAPHWDGRARGTIVGMSRGTRREHLVRAALEAIAYRTRDVVETMEAATGLGIESLNVDGGAVKNDFLCQLQADLVGSRIVRPVVDETTALGAAYAAGLAVGYWSDPGELRANRRIDRTFEPEMATAEADRRYSRWGDAVDRARDWVID